MYVDALLESWIVRLVRSTRALDEVEIGASVRGSLALIKVARAWALLHQRLFVQPSDIEALFVSVLGHRLMATPTYLAEMRGVSREEMFGRIRTRCLEAVPPPSPDWKVDGGDERPSWADRGWDGPGDVVAHVAAHGRTTFPLVPKYRVTGLPLGSALSLRRGHGSDVAGSRAYVRGDPISTIDWRASARLSTARGRDEFVVRERYVDEAPRVVMLCDRRISMTLYPPPFPWLSKVEAVQSVVELIVASAQARNSSVGYLDYAGSAERGGEPYWLAPTSRALVAVLEDRRLQAADFDAPDDGIALGLDFLGRFRSELSSGTFVFVISDFLGARIPDSVLLTAAARRWEVVPVVIQDPTWEQSFPLVDSVVVPFVEPGGREVLDVRFSRRETRARKEANERRRDELLAGFASLGLDPVLVGTSDSAVIDHTFAEWADSRRTLRQRR